LTVAELPAPQEGPIVAKLVEAGYDVGSLAELRHSGVRYLKAIPVMIAALSEVTEQRALMEVVRVLSVPWAKPDATGPLVNLFRRVEDSNGLGLRWAVGNALDVTWDDTHFDDLVELACNRSYGRAREMVVLGLARSKRPEAGDILIGLLDDPDVNGHAVKALGKLKLPRARSGLELMTSDSRGWVRKEAQRALAALG
jgi:HEAT repeat protein